MSDVSAGRQEDPRKDAYAEPGVHVVGIDIGGTFTDFVFREPASGVERYLKLPTDHARLDQPVIEGMRAFAAAAAAAAGEASGFAFADVSHGSTIAVNAILERSGARLGLLCSEGFRDVLELRRVRMEVPIRFDSSRPEVLIPRSRVRAVPERVNPDGTIGREPVAATVRHLVRELLARDCEGIVIALLHSYANPSNEHLIAGLIEDEWPDLPVYCSSDLWPQIREYERTICTTLNSYVQKSVAGYIGKLQDFARAAGLRGELFITKCNGGCTVASNAIKTPVQTLLSGPASGIVGAMEVATSAGVADAITFDMGGTSTDIGLLSSSGPVMSRDAHVGGFPIVVPSVEVSSIGAGGGSIAYASRAGVIRVGPRSAGSVPGPACYGWGGVEPTVTDALVACGIVSEKSFAGGRMKIEPELARRALATVGDPLGLTVAECADAILEVAEAGLVLGVKDVLARHGLDPRDLSLVAFGGAGPLFGAHVAGELGLRNVLVPRRPGTLCALGALLAPLRGDFVRTVYAPLERLTPEGIESIVDSLRKEAGNWVSETGMPGVGATRLALTVSMRYRGQAWSVDVPFDSSQVDSGVDISKLAAGFHDRHGRLYGHADSDSPIDLIDVHASIVAVKARTDLPAVPSGVVGEPAGEKPDIPSMREVRIHGDKTSATVYSRSVLEAGQTIDGPAIIEQEDTTVLIPAGHYVAVDGSLNIVIERKGRV